MANQTFPTFPSASHLVDKTVVVIGGSSGVGHGAVKAALEHGAKVTIGSSSPEKIQWCGKSLEELHESFGGQDLRL
ncbi:hypothetical protein CALCODRAFT_487314 [Calocera cornea HHB12733]|uniref:NAD(P)-binding protein n=1 Tax=Calocera cornea HHB12733 TaxID=1353952 RepID=A0A165D7C3_9BASI|nr:hypothetical protein CALCODRAFT_487314 [Calocera cornea HHB12733]